MHYLVSTRPARPAGLSPVHQPDRLPVAMPVRQAGIALAGGGDPVPYPRKKHREHWRQPLGSGFNLWCWPRLQLRPNKLDASAIARLTAAGSLIVTSQFALLCAVRYINLHRCNVVAVGSQTARLASRLQAGNVITAGGNAGSLNRLLSHMQTEKKRTLPEPIIHICGNHRAYPVKMPGKAVAALEIYRQLPLVSETPLPLAAAILRGDVKLLLLYSALTATATGRSLRRSGIHDLKRCRVLCHSHTIARAFAETGVKAMLDVTALSGLSFDAFAPYTGSDSGFMRAPSEAGLRA